MYLRKEETEAHGGSVICLRSCREWQHRVPTLDDVGLKQGGLPATPPAEPRATLSSHSLTGQGLTGALIYSKRTNTWAAQCGEAARI